MEPLAKSLDHSDVTFPTPFDERRFKIVSINANFIIDVLNWWRNPPDMISLPMTDELPEDCKVISLTVSWERQCIEAIVVSKEFPRTPDGATIERISGMVCEMRRIPFGQVSESTKDQIKGNNDDE